MKKRCTEEQKRSMARPDTPPPSQKYKPCSGANRETAIKNSLAYIRLNEHKNSSKEQVKEAWSECKQWISEEIVENIFRKYGVTLDDSYLILDHLRMNLNSFVKF